MEISVGDLRNNLAGYLKGLKGGPITVINHKRAVAILSPVTEEETLYQSMKSGEIDYDQYRRKMLGIGYQNLLDQKATVRPSDVINSERVENEKARTRIEASDFLLQAAKFWAGHNKWHICSNCGHMMLPKEIYDEEKQKGELPEHVVWDESKANGT